MLLAGSPRIDGSPAKFPISKLKLDNLFLQWLSMTESQNLVCLKFISASCSWPVSQRGSAACACLTLQLQQQQRPQTLSTL